ncbi:MAG TPA: LamG domain-containing protein [Anaerolineales bacterium]|nr:LamG domain-containing protein [Anaerolineales bacterium]
MRSVRRLTQAFVLCLILALGALAWPRAAQSQSAPGLSLRFYGHGANAPDVDRVKILIDPGVSADIGATDFTIEVWLKTASGNNAGAITAGANANWINGNIFIDRDIYNAPAYGDFGLSLGAGRVAFGVTTGQGSRTIVGTTDLRDGAWHHVAVTRNLTTGQMRLFVDGVQEASATGPTGDASYQDGRGTSYPNSDPYLVLGAEKHDVGTQYPAYSGWMDELRLSRVVRYTSGFTRPSGAFTADGDTAALYHFDEGVAGACTGAVLDSSGGSSHGQCRYGGSGTAGPVYSSDTPFGGTPEPTTVARTPRRANADIH